MLSLFVIVSVELYDQQQRQNTVVAQQQPAILQKISLDVERDNLTTYTNPRYGISLLYPSQWINEEIGGVLANAQEENKKFGENENSSSYIHIPSNRTNYGSVIPSSKSAEGQKHEINDTGYLTFLISFRPALKEFGEFVFLDVSVKNLSARNTTLSEYTRAEINFLKKPVAMPSGESVLRRFIESNTTSIAGNTQAHKVVYLEEVSGFQAKIMEIWAIKGDKAYTLSYVTDATTFDLYLPTIQKMVDSFQLISQY